MPTAGSDTFDGTGEFAYNDATGCTVFTVHCQSGSTQKALVNIAGLHDDSEFFVLEKGQTIDFRMAGSGIRKVFIKGDGGNCTVNFGVTAKVTSPFGQESQESGKE